MTIVYLEVKPHKLSNRELAKVFETLKRQGQVTSDEDRKLNTQLGKAYYVRTNHRYVTVRIPQNKLEAFVERTRIDDADIKTVRGGISRDLTALEQELEKDEAAPDYSYPSLPLIGTGDVHKSILETIKKMDEQSFNLEENTNRANGMNVTLSTLYDPEEEATDVGDLSAIQGEENQQSFKPEPQEAPPAPNEKIPVLLNTDTTPDPRNNGSDLRLDAGLSIPVWKKGRDRQEEILNTRMFIRDLRRLKSLGVLKKEALLINATLVKSGRTQLYEELPAEAETSVDEFVKYLKKAYGMNRFDLMKELQNVTQGATENPHTFLSRVITLYYEAKGKTKKTVDQIKTNEDETYEIVGLFWRGLYDQRVRVMLKQRMDGMKIEDLADVTKNIESSYKEMQGSAVNLVDEKVDELVHETNVLHIGSPKFRKANDRKPWNTKERFRKHMGKSDERNKSCYSCGRPGHFARDCRKNQDNNVRRQKSNIRCFKCNGFGHIALQCKKTGHPQSPRKPATMMKCYNCGRPGHYAKDCRSKPQSIRK